MEALKLELINRIKAARFERLLLPHMPIELHDPTSEERDNVEQYIADRFFATYQANVNSFLPYLLSSNQVVVPIIIYLQSLAFNPLLTNHYF